VLEVGDRVHYRSQEHEGLVLRAEVMGTSLQEGRLMKR
jgi:hypothetical protein